MEAARSHAELTPRTGWARRLRIVIGGATFALGIAALPSIGVFLLPVAICLLWPSLGSTGHVGEALLAAAAVWLALAIANSGNSSGSVLIVLGSVALVAGLAAAAYARRS